MTNKGLLKHQSKYPNTLSPFKNKCDKILVLAVMKWKYQWIDKANIDGLV